MISSSRSIRRASALRGAAGRRLLSRALGLAVVVGLARLLLSAGGPSVIEAATLQAGESEQPFGNLVDPGAPGMAQVASGSAAELDNLPVVVAAGDIASCGSSGDEATANLLSGPNVTVVTLGDNAYPGGAANDFATCYGPSWGRQLARTRPGIGNHEYDSANAAPYFNYFGLAAGEPGKGYYSYDLGSWHLIALNSNCEIVGCGVSSSQGQWLRRDLAAHPAACTLAYWHHPFFSSGANHGDDAAVQPLFQALYEAGADLVLVGHEHVYERFAPQDPQGRSDPRRGIRQFVVGTGGASHYSFAQVRPNSERRDGDTYGVLRLVLGPTSYDWRFVPEAGKSFNDSGSGVCH